MASVNDGVSRLIIRGTMLKESYDRDIPIKYYSSVSAGLRETKAASATVVMALLNLPCSSLIFHT